MKPNNSVGTKEEDERKFRLYSFYAWGMSCACLLITIVMDSSMTPDTFIKPRFGYKTCWIYGKAATWLYFYGPLALILFSNLIFFISTIYKVTQITKNIKSLKDGDSDKHCKSECLRLSLHIKLFVVMGLAWFMEIISYTADGSSEFIWYLTDIFNCLRGLVIFIIFVVKKRILILLNKRLCPQIELFTSMDTSSQQKAPTTSTTSASDQTQESRLLASAQPNTTSNHQHLAIRLSTDL